MKRGRKPKEKPIIGWTTEDALSHGYSFSSEEECCAHGWGEKVPGNSLMSDSDPFRVEIRRLQLQPRSGQRRRR